MCPISNGFRNRAVSLYRNLDLAPNIALPSRRTALLYETYESVRNVSWSLRLLIMTFLGLLCKIPHIFTTAEYADVLYVYGFCDGSATAEFDDGIF